MTNYLLYPLLCFWLLQGSAAAFDPCRDAPSAYRKLETRYTRGLLFKVEKCGQPVSYLFGTLHMDDPDITKAASQAFAILPRVQEAGFEILASTQELQKEAKKYMFVAPDDPQRLSKLIGIVYFAKLVRLLGTNPASLTALERSQPWAVAMLVEVKDIVTGGLVLDEQLKKAAENAHKTLFALETPDEQFNVFAQSPKPYQVILLKDTIEEYDTAHRIREQMQAAYRGHDGLKLLELNNEMLKISKHPTIDAYYDKRLLDDRNGVMEKRLKPHLEKAASLTCVGMLHLLGKGGVIDLLERDGYDLSAMP